MMLEQMLYSEQCTGCKLCREICPVSAISMVEDEGGFWYPEVDEKKCIECGLCEKKCPSLGTAATGKKDKPEVYAAWSKNDKVRLNSTSGGICYELSKSVIASGGYVAGVAYTDDFKGAEYVLINDQAGLDRITQTKYFQASADGIYEKVKEKLEKGYEVLFIGPPCYQAALHSFLGKEYENLIQCDYVCRGNPSPKVHRLHIEYQEKNYNSKVVLAHSKNKRKGWRCFGTYLKFENGKEFYKDRYHNPMTILFSRKNINIRDSCFSCQYRTVPRLSDIMLGDFWGISGMKKKEYFNGISIFMINSAKGRALFDRISDAIEYEERSLEEVAGGNPALFDDPKKSESSQQFWQDINELPFGDVLKKYVNKNEIGRRKWRNRLSRIKRMMREARRINVIQFIHYNYLCSSVIRKKGKYLIPYRGSCIDIKKGAEIRLEGNVFLNTHRMRSSRAECYFSVEKGAKVQVKERFRLGCQSTVHVNSGGCLVIDKMGTNWNCNIQCSNSITIGDDVILGRDVMIYDSDYHQTGVNAKKSKVAIGDHVWIGSRAMLMKGARIGDGAIVSANAWVTGRVKEHTLVSGMPAKRLMDHVKWRA